MMPVPQIETERLRLGPLALTRVIADTHVGNGASRRVAEKIGMRATGRTPGAEHHIRYQARSAARR